MIKTRSRIKYAALIPVFVLATFVAQFANVQLASAATLVWDGSAGDNKFSTAANWNTNAVPVDGDVLSFNIATATDYTALNNDLTGLSVAGINYTGNGTAGSYYITGNVLTVTGNLTSTATSGQYTAPLSIQTGVVLGTNITAQNVSLGGTGKTLDTQGHSISISGECASLPKLVGSGTVTTTGTTSSISLVEGANAYTGNIVITAGSVYAPLGSLGTAAGTTTVQGSGKLSLYANADSTWAESFILGGTGSIGLQHSSTNGCSGGGVSGIYTGTFTAPVTLNTDFKYNGSDNMTITGTYNANGHSFTTESGASGTLTTPEGTSAAPAEENTYSDAQPNQYLNVGANQTAILDGSRSYVNVGLKGLLLGTGTAQSLSIDGGTVNPGHSPGTLTVLEAFQLYDGVYQAELKTSAAGEYDQLKVSNATRTTGSDVYLDTNANLQVSLYDGYSIKQGDTFTIIDNQQPASQLVQGTFVGLAEGAQFSVEGIIFSISYVGGDGNDVILTALNAGADPNAPNTGAMQLVKGNPILVAGLGIATAAIMIAVATRRRANR